MFGRLPAGERIPEGELSDLLGVSRTPLREALKVLAEENLVQLQPNRGARVISFTVKEATALFEVIAALESLAVELLATQITPEQLAALEDMHARMVEHYRRHERDPYFELNSAIHEAIVAYAGNEVLSGTHARLMVRASRGRYMAIIDPARWDEAVEEHDLVMDALRRHDAQRAREVWRQHLRRSGEVVCAVINARETAGEAAAD